MNEPNKPSASIAKAKFLDLSLIFFTRILLIFFLFVIFFFRSALQTLHKVSGKAREQNYFLGGLSHDWVSYYEQRIESDRSCLNEWHAMDNLESKRPPSPDSVRTKWVDQTLITVHRNSRSGQQIIDRTEILNNLGRSRVLPSRRAISQTFDLVGVLDAFAFRRHRFTENIYIRWLSPPSETNWPSLVREFNLVPCQIWWFVDASSLAVYAPLQVACNTSGA